MTHSKALKIRIWSGSSVGMLFLGVALIPYIFIGEYWGMVWMYVTAPVSFVVEERMGIGADSYALIGATSLACAFLWAALAYAIVWIVQTCAR